MERTIYLGKIAYSSSAKRNPVEVTLRYNNGGFTASGMIWSERRADAYYAGQCLDTIAEYIKTPLFREIHRLWKAHHLNDMRPECEHQRDLGWPEIATRETAMHHFSLTHEAYMERRKIETAAIKALRKSGNAAISPEEQAVLNLPASVTTHLPELSVDVAPYYKHARAEIKKLGHLRPDEHPAGILSKECPACGYKYGTAWNTLPIPPEDEAIIIKLIETGTL